MSSRAKVAAPLAMAGELVSRSPRCEAQKRLRPESDSPRGPSIDLEDSAAGWLHITAVRLFPDSDYARLASTSTAKAQRGDAARDINHRV